LIPAYLSKVPLDPYSENASAEVRYVSGPKGPAFYRRPDSTSDIKAPPEGWPIYAPEPHN
jgi:hypothetical protein